MTKEPREPVESTAKDPARNEGEAFLRWFLMPFVQDFWLYAAAAVAFVIFLIFCAVTGWEPG